MLMSVSKRCQMSCYVQRYSAYCQRRKEARKYSHIFTFFMKVSFKPVNKLSKLPTANGLIVAALMKDLKISVIVKKQRRQIY